jgi:cytochrome c556
MKTALSFAFSLLLAAGAAHAQSVGDTITARQTGYKNMAAAFGDVKKVLDASGDTTTVAAKAQEVSDWAHKITGVFPVGSGPESGIKTRALPAIWANKADFDLLAGNLGREADKLVVALKSGDKAASLAAFQATGGACGACHRTYRAPQ